MSGSTNRAVLETFLSGMETGDTTAGDLHAGALETFLSGMETRSRRPVLSSAPALKPSLVEWKPPCMPSTRQRSSCLETFLSGMETASSSSA